MKVTVDGVIFKYQAHGGISRLFANLLPRMCDLEESLEIELLISGRPLRCLPRHRRIRYRHVPPIEVALRPMRLWGECVWKARACAQQVWLGNDNSGIWHSTYYTLPVKWRGPVVVSVMDMIHERFGDLYVGTINDNFRERKRRAVMTADMVICISKTTARDVRELYGIGPDRIRVIPLACDAVFGQRTSERVRYSVSQPRRYFLYVGERSPYKNFRGMLEAYRGWEGRAQVDLVVVGKPWSREERRGLQDLLKSHRLHLRTHISDEELCVLYTEARAFVYPSLYEGFGIPLLEAMACGCPIIASRIPSNYEVAGDCPIYFDAAAVEDLTSAFNVVLAEGRDSERVRRGFERVREYSWDNTAKQTIETYRDVCRPA